MQSSLDSFVTSSKSPPQPIATSQEVRDRGSIFVANIFKATSVKEVKDAIGFLRDISHSAKPAHHEISAWRCMVVKSDRSGLGGEDDFEVTSGYNDDGERYAGERILKVMKSLGIIDAVVIVSRWYGGILLGPARFSHVETCTVEVCRRFKSKEEMEERMATLTSLDDILSTLRAEYAGIMIANGVNDDVIIGAKRKSDYSSIEKSMDLAKAGRLIRAREDAIRMVKKSIQKAGETRER